MLEFRQGRVPNRVIGEERSLRAAMYQRASAISLAIVLVSVVLAAFVAAPVAGLSPAAAPIIAHFAPGGVLLTPTASQRVALSEFGGISVRCYRDLLLVTGAGATCAATP